MFSLVVRLPHDHSDEEREVNIAVEARNAHASDRADGEQHLLQEHP